MRTEAEIKAAIEAVKDGNRSCSENGLEGPLKTGMTGGVRSRMGHGKRKLLRGNDRMLLAIRAAFDGRKSSEGWPKH